MQRGRLTAALTIAKPRPVRHPMSAERRPLREIRGNEHMLMLCSGVKKLASQ